MLCHMTLELLHGSNQTSIELALSGNLIVLLVKQRPLPSKDNVLLVSKSYKSNSFATLN